MKKAALVAVISVATLAVLAQVSIPQAWAGAAQAQCPRGDEILRGAYMSKGGGTVVGVGPVTFIGTIYLDGKGGVVNPFTASFNGTILRGNGSGTYTVESDCSGTQIGITPSGTTQTYDIRVSPDGSKFDFIETDADTVISGTATRLKD